MPLDLDLRKPSKANHGSILTGVIDCDIHPVLASGAELNPWLSQRWREHLKEYGGGFYRQALADTLSHPRMSPAVARADAWPPGGGQPGTDPGFMREQLLDAYDMAYGMLMPLGRGPGNQRNLELGAALAHAVNEWQIAKWIGPEPRLKGSIVITQEDPEAAIREIELRGSDPRFVQVMFPPRSIEPIGRKRYWPIYEAIVASGKPLAMHIGGINGWPSTPGGYHSYYIEEQHNNATCMQTAITSLIVEGVLERFPGLRIVLVEGGIAWAPALKWRLDKHWRRLRSEAPHLKRLPSEVVREHFWFTTQPLDEPKADADLAETFELVGTDRIMFSTDYPHWDFDEPAFVLSKLKLPRAELERIFSGNARALYGLA